MHYNGDGRSFVVKKDNTLIYTDTEKTFSPIDLYSKGPNGPSRAVGIIMDAAVDVKTMCESHTSSIAFPKNKGERPLNPKLEHIITGKPKTCQTCILNSLSLNFLLSNNQPDLAIRQKQTNG